LAKKDKDIILLTGDLGYSFIEKFQEELPNQFINAGIAEQNATGIAGGLALSGKKPWCYSGTIFMLMRPYEQIRNICYNNLNVKFVGTGASQFLGFSHNLQKSESEKDLLKNLPIMQWYPETDKQLNATMIYENNHKGQAFIRL
jgi:transketolase